MARKKKLLGPRRKRMKRVARLQSAVHWLPTYKGQKVVRAYARWFGIDLGCALKELELLGVPLEPSYVKQLRATLATSRRAKPAAPPSTDFPGYGVDWDDNFAYIAGFTSGGAPFGTTWDARTLELALRALELALGHSRE